MTTTPSTSSNAGPSYSYPSSAAARHTPTKLSPGSGVLHLSPSESNKSISRPDGIPRNPNLAESKARFSTLSAAYPLKLLSPSPLPSQPSSLALVYTLAYGGGLVAGDLISLRGEVGEGCGLVMLTQGSTKVYKRRPGLRPMSRSVRGQGPTQDQKGSSSSPDSGSDMTRQRLHITLAPHSMLLLLPDSISPFAQSQYSQVQRFVLPADGTASALILDWVNSGRGQRAPSNGRGDERVVGHEDEEIWSMDVYGSTNEVYVGDRCVMRERMVLDNRAFEREVNPPKQGPAQVSAGLPTGSEADPTTSPDSVKTQEDTRVTPPDPKRTSITNADSNSVLGHPRPQLSPTALHLAPYNTYATVLVLGPAFGPLVSYIKNLADKTRQYQLKTPPGLIWSFSEVDTSSGAGVVRIAGRETEDVRSWIRALLGVGGVGELVGEGLWPRVI